MTCIFIFFSEFYNPLHPFTYMRTHIAYLIIILYLYTQLDVRLPMIFCNHRTLVVFCTFVKHDSKVEEQSSIINKHLSSHIILLDFIQAFILCKLV